MDKLIIVASLAIIGIIVAGILGYYLGTSSTAGENEEPTAPETNTTGTPKETSYSNTVSQQENKEGCLCPRFNYVFSVEFILPEEAFENTSEPPPFPIPFNGLKPRLDLVVPASSNGSTYFVLKSFIGYFGARVGFTEDMKKIYIARSISLNLPSAPILGGGTGAREMENVTGNVTIYVKIYNLYGDQIGSGSLVLNESSRGIMKKKTVYIPITWSVENVSLTDIGKVVFKTTINVSKIPFNESETPPEENEVEITDAYLAIVHMATSNQVFLQISIRNVADEPVTLESIIVDDIFIDLNGTVLNSGVTYSNTFPVINATGSNMYKWESGTEHRVTLVYRYNGEIRTVTLTLRAV